MTTRSAVAVDFDDESSHDDSINDTATNETEHKLGGKTYRLTCQPKRNDHITHNTSHAGTLS